MLLVTLRGVKKLLLSCFVTSSVRAKELNQPIALPGVAVQNQHLEAGIRSAFTFADGS